MNVAKAMRREYVTGVPVGASTTAEERVELKVG